MTTESEFVFLGAKQVKMAIEQTEGKVFVVHFVKKNGALRKMRARRDVNAQVLGVGKSYNSEDHGLIDVFDMEDRSRSHQQGRHKSIPLGRMIYFKCGGTVLGAPSEG